MLNKIDLHMHTTCSDGSDSPEQLFKNLEKRDIEIFSITDHNTVNAYFLPEINKHKGMLIPGVEITCMFQGEIVEVLGYGFDVEIMKRELAHYLYPFREKQLREFEIIFSTLKNRGMIMNKGDITFDPDREAPRRAILREIGRHEENRKFFINGDFNITSKEFTRQGIYNKESILYVDLSPLYPSIKKAVDMIHISGGIAFLAHLYEYAHGDRYFENLENIVKEYSLDGLECAHSCYNDEEIKKLNSFCDSHNLLKSCGSDYHGTRKKNVELCTVCGNRSLYSDYIENWPESYKFNYVLKEG